MIPYEELVAALDRWRLRNGLPVVADVLPEGGEAPQTALPMGGFVMPAMAAATAPRPEPARPASEAELYEDAEVMEEDEYDNEGNDYAMQFSESAPEAAAAPPPADPALYDEGGAGYDQATYVAEEAAADPAGYDTAYGRADEYQSAADAGAEVEEEEDWSKMPNFPGNGPGDEPIDAGDEVLDEHAVDDDEA